MDVFIVGSAYSSQQSWAEGALITSEYMLQKYYGLTPMNGIEEDYAINQLLKF